MTAGQAGVAVGVVHVVLVHAVVTARAVPWGAGCVVPHALWLTVATSLAVGYGRLVPRGTSARS